MPGTVRCGGDSVSKWGPCPQGTTILKITEDEQQTRKTQLRVASAVEGGAWLLSQDAVDLCRGPLP